MRGIKLWIALLSMTAVLLAGCGNPNEERITVCKVQYAGLVDRHNALIDLYADSPSREYDERIASLGNKLESMGEQDVSRLATQELEALEAELQAAEEEYAALYEDIASLVDRQGQEGQTGVSVTLKNSTSIRFQELYFYPKAGGDGRIDFLLEGEEAYDGYDVLNAVGLVVDEGEPVWQVEAADEEGDLIHFGEVDLTPYIGGNLTIELLFDFDARKGRIEIK